MVQLPATAAIEYVAACCRTRTKTKTVRGAYARSPKFPGGILPGGLLSGGLMPVPPNFNANTHRLGFLCLAS